MTKMFLKSIPHKIIALSIALISVGCATGPTHPALVGAELNRTVPVRQFVANTDHIDDFNLSPDGTKMVYRGVSSLRPAIKWRSLTGGKTHAIEFKKRSPYPFWSADSRYLLYVADPSGREEYSVFAIDTQFPDKPARNLTPMEGIRSYVHQVPLTESDDIYIGHNGRDQEVFDIYRLNVTSGEQELLHKNVDNVIATTLADNGEIRARVRQTEDARILEIPSDNGWRNVITAGVFDAMHIVSLNKDGTSMYLLSNVGRDRIAAIELNIETLEETVLYEHPTVDVDGMFVSQKDLRPLMAFARPDYPHIHFFDEKLERQMAPMYERGKNGLNIMSINDDETMMTAATYDETGGIFQLIDLETGEIEVLGESSARKNADVMQRHTPIEFTARDGLTIRGFVTRPETGNDKPVPTVVLVHGGPWARDTWGHIDQAQFLANRGYAVLQINYRGSAGYGREFMFAAVNEFAGKMHTDLIDGLDWAIDQGITDPDRVAIMGGSYGGYATLVGMTMTPDRFQCGIDIVGVSDLPLLWETMPVYWKSFIPFWKRFVGDPSDPEQLKTMQEKSPVNFAEQVQGPLLIIHGVNDPRVVLEHSDRMVSELRKYGKEVDYLVIDDEGHGFQHWKHQMTQYRKTEDFLAKCLGGRSGGLDYYQLGSWAF